jgi:hypothetical protein
MTDQIGSTRVAGKIGDAVLCDASSALNDGRSSALCGPAALAP